MVNEEEAFGIVFRFDPYGASNNSSPISVLPRSIEVITFGNVRTSVGSKLA